MNPKTIIAEVMSEVCLTNNYEMIQFNLKPGIATKGRQKKSLSREEAMRRHQTADKKYRQNMNKGFAALKTIVKQNRKQISGQVMTGVHIKTEPIIRKKAEKMSRIDVIKETMDLIGSKENQIDNILNELTLSQNSIDRVTPVIQSQSMAFNGLQKIKDMFNLFEKRYDSELREIKPKKKNEETSIPEVKISDWIQKNIPLTSKKSDPLISEENIGPKQEIKNELSLTLIDTPLEVINPVPTREWITDPVDSSIKTVVNLQTGQYINEDFCLNLAIEKDQSLTKYNEKKESPTVGVVEWDATIALDFDTNPMTADLNELLELDLPFTSFGTFSCFDDSYNI